MDRRVVTIVGWPAGRHVDHPCAGQFRHGLLEKPLKRLTDFKSTAGTEIK